MLNSSYDGEIEQWDMIDKYSMNVIYTASVDIRRRMSAKKRSFDFVEFDTDLVGEQDIYPSEYVISDNSGHCLSLIHISEPTRLGMLSRMPSSA